MNTSTAKRLLIVDDNESDIELITLALEELGCTPSVSTASNGADAVALLDKVGAEPAADPPDAMVLDLNMPRMGGQEVLAYIASRPALATMPVAVLSTSDSPRDRATCLQLGARLYIVKAYRLVDFIASLKPVAELLADGGPPR
jgi:CheY-like chemotaxis protein